MLNLLRFLYTYTMFLEDLPITSLNVNPIVNAINAK